MGCTLRLCEFVHLERRHVLVPMQPLRLQRPCVSPLLNSEVAFQVRFAEPSVSCLSRFCLPPAVSARTPSCRSLMSCPGAAFRWAPPAGRLGVLLALLVRTSSRAPRAPLPAACSSSRRT